MMFDLLARRKACRPNHDLGRRWLPGREAKVNLAIQRQARYERGETDFGKCFRLPAERANVRQLDLPPNT